MFKFLNLIALLVLFSTHLEAASYKGQREFVKQCVKCHKGGQDFVSSKTSIEWKKLLVKKGQALANVHINSTDKKALDSIEYFNSIRYGKNAKHLMDFLTEFAKDSGRVPACN